MRLPLTLDLVDKIGEAALDKRLGSRVVHRRLLLSCDFEVIVAHVQRIEGRYLLVKASPYSIIVYTITKVVLGQRLGCFVSRFVGSTCYTSTRHVPALYILWVESQLEQRIFKYMWPTLIHTLELQGETRDTIVKGRVAIVK